ncbi:hypothetical protein OS493_020655 [Desmophyllum pertusum]|uniref:Uncharacterized protein n=1 Tax=Desmophyllum pertusum TaxID=174260 RepID=A0A9W9YZG7_9CNID|nr:hypothetical protein OS493_020655 [Desmophyllum pertusum]
MKIISTFSRHPSVPRQRNKREQQRVVIEDEVIIEQADCAKETGAPDESRTSLTEDEMWMRKDCFEDLLEGLEDDEDFLDEALLV